MLMLYGGDDKVYLPLATAELCRWAASSVDPLDANPTVRRAWPGARRTGLGFPVGFRPDRPVEPGTFRWPVGASRWAQGHFLVSRDLMLRLRRMAFGKGAFGTAPLTLRMDSPGLYSREVVETEVYLLPPSPLRRVSLNTADNAAYNGLYLLTLVDVRYYWWSVPTPDLGFDDEHAPSWTSLLLKCGVALGVPIQHDAIPVTYQRPHRSLALTDEPLPMVLDAICASIGLRLVRRLDGSVWAESPPAADASAAADVLKHRQRTVRSGGVRFREAL